MENYFYLNEKDLNKKGPVSPEELISNGVTREHPRVEKRYDRNGLAAGEVPELAKWFTNTTSTPSTPPPFPPTPPQPSVNNNSKPDNWRIWAILIRPVLCCLPLRDCIYHLRHKK